MLSLRILIVTFVVITKVFLPSCSCSSKGLCEGDDEKSGDSLNIYAANFDEEASYVSHVAKFDSPDKLKKVENIVEANSIFPVEFIDEPEHEIVTELHPAIISELPPSHPLKSTLIGGRWILLDTLDSGHFGDVYIGVDRITAMKVAVKVEKPRYMSLLSTEHQIYRRLRRHDGFVTAHHCERLSRPPVTVLVMDLMGPSLGKLLCSSPGRKFSLKTVLMLAVQMIDRLEALHECHYIHRDIKPENFVIGLGDSQDKIYLIDFGLAKMYRDPHNPDRHIPIRLGVPFSGTMRHTSARSHRGVEQSRRDDLESLGYTLVYMLNGSLPWHLLPDLNLNQTIHQMKSNTSVDTLCTGCPMEFGLFFHHVRSLEFSQAPDYLYLKSLFNQASTRCGLDGHTLFDWMKPEESSIKAP